MNRADEIKKSIKDAGLKCWQVADEIGISSFTFSVWLRHLDQYPDRRARIDQAMKNLTR